MRKSLYAVTLMLLSIACRSRHPIQPPLSLAAFTPDASGIVFSVASGDTCFLYTAEIAAPSVRRLTKSGSGCEFDPAFSSDGRRLAFMRAPRNGFRAALIIAGADGSNDRVLVAADQDNLHPVFVPHSNQILFLRSAAFEHHSPLVDSDRHKFDLFLADSANGDVVALTHKQFYGISHVSVSADATKVLLTVVTYPEGNHFLIATLRSPETFTENLQPAVPGGPALPVMYNAEWLPDGQTVLFMGASETSIGSMFDYNIYRLAVGTDMIERLTQLTGLLDGFSVSMDGKKAVLLRDGAYSILDLNTRQLTPIELRWP